MNDLIIETRGIQKTYFPRKGAGEKGIVEAVKSVSFEVKRGEIFGLLGPNGAGKTTTMRMLSTLLTPTGGSASVAGFDLISGREEIRERIGYVSQVGGMEREATGRENLLLQAKLYGMKNDEANARTEEVIRSLDIAAFADRRTSSYSGGQRRIFDLASGIIHKPELLFLDEPSTGLDPQNRAHVWEEVKRLRSEGTSIFLTTHYLEEADVLCDRVAIVDRGTVVALGTPAELKRQIAGDIIVLGFESPETASLLPDFFAGASFMRDMEVKDGTAHLYVEHGDANLPEIIQTLHEKGIHTKTIGLSRPTLDDVFLKLTGRTLTEPEGAR